MQIFKNRIFLGLLSIAMAVIIGFVMVPVISNATSQTTEVVRASKAISVGETFTEENAVLVEVGKLNLPEGTAFALQDVIGRYATTDMQPGDIITTQKIAEKLVLPENKIRAMQAGETYIPIRINESSNLTRFLPNDIVTIYAPNATGSYEIVPELQYLSVVTTTTAAGVDIMTANQTDQNGGRLVATSITFILTRRQAEVLLSHESIRILLTYRGNNDAIINQYLSMQNAILSASSVPVQTPTTEQTQTTEPTQP